MHVTETTVGSLLSNGTDATVSRIPDSAPEDARAFLLTNAAGAVRGVATVRNVTDSGGRYLLAEIGGQVTRSGSAQLKKAIKAQLAYLKRQIIFGVGFGD